LIIRKESFDAKQALRFKQNAVIGTSSARRKAQMLHFRPDIEIKDIRGNVPTRLQKLREEQFDAILLAGAGITRLEIDLSEFEVIKFNPKEFVPAPAQGVLALQIRAEDQPLSKLLRKLHHPEVAECTNVERKLLQLFDGGCQLPFGAYCERDAQGVFHAWAVKADSWDGDIKRVQYSASTKAGMAEKLHEMLLSQPG
jgi:hydroxymethylbilane synthase